MLDLLLARHPLGVRLALGAAFALGAACAGRAADRFVRESDEADRCRRAALAFVWPALIGALPGALWVLAARLDSP